MRRTSTMAYFALGLGIAVAGTGCSRDMNQARDNQPVTGSADSADRTGIPLASADRDFITKAAMGAMTEIELGRIAQSKGRSQAVKDFGKRLVDDHSTANNKLRTIAADLNVSLPATLDSEHQAAVDKYSKMAGGANFDRQFMKDAVEDHQKDIQEFQTASNTAMNDRVKSFASETLPTLREHLQIAQSGVAK